MNFENIGRDLGNNTEKLDEGKEAAMLPEEINKALSEKLDKASDKISSLAKEYNKVREENGYGISSEAALKNISSQIERLKEVKEGVDSEIDSLIEKMSYLLKARLRGEMNDEANKN